MTGHDRQDGQESMDNAAAVRDAGDVCVVLGRSPQALAAPQGAVFRRFLPMARPVAASAVPAGGRWTVVEVRVGAFAGGHRRGIVVDGEVIDAEPVPRTHL